MLKITTSTKFDGTFWVGDPCYVFPDERWSEFCRVLFKEEERQENRRTPIFMEDEGETFFVASTAYGDGCYPVEIGGARVGDCGVDAGLLALIPLSLIKKWGDDSKDTLGLVVKVSGVPEGDGEGDWDCGKLSVRTGGSRTINDEEESFDEI